MSHLIIDEETHIISSDYKIIGTNGCLFEQGMIIPEAKDYDFEVADITVKGDMKFTHIELYCNQCNKYYTIKEVKKNKF